MGDRFRILSLDGGGIRGAFSAAFLAGLEQQIGRPIGEYFDLIAGTSTGAIIAAALAIGEPAAKIETLYRDHAAEIFGRPPRRTSPMIRLTAGMLKRFLKFGVGVHLELDADALLHAKYGSAGLRKALESVFGDRTLEHVPRRLVIPAVDLARSQTVVFKTPHLPGMTRDRHLRIVDVLMATTAAPTYFPHSCISAGSAYCDGGLWANNPSAVALAEASRISTECRRTGVDPVFGPAGVWMLSVGTGSAPYDVSPPTDEKDGLLFWGARAIDVMAASQSQGMGFLTRFLLPAGQYERVDMTLPAAWKLDATECMDRLVHLGHERAHADAVGLRTRFFERLAASFARWP